MFIHAALSSCSGFAPLLPHPAWVIVAVMKQLVVLLLLAALAIVAGTGCNTANGFGKDVTNAGDAIQDGTK